MNLDVGIIENMKHEIRRVEMCRIPSPNPILEKRNFMYRFGRICKCYMSLSKVTPPTAQTGHHKDLKFGMDTHVRPNRGATEAIFDKLPQSRDMGQGWG